MSVQRNEDSSLCLCLQDKVTVLLVKAVMRRGRREGEILKPIGPKSFVRQKHGSVQRK